MPRQARLDAPGALHHIMARGIEGVNILIAEKNRSDFLSRLAEQCGAGALRVYAWALIPNHFHLLIRGGGEEREEGEKGREGNEAFLPGGGQEIWSYEGKCKISRRYDIFGQAICRHWRAS